MAHTARGTALRTRSFPNVGRACEVCQWDDIDTVRKVIDTPCGRAVVRYHVPW